MIHLLAIGQKMPLWVDTAVETYLTRMRAPYKVKLTTIAASTRTTHTTQLASELEAKKILLNIPTKCTPIALCVEGKLLDSYAFTNKIKQWVESAQPPCFIIGGADGLAPTVVKACAFKLSLSNLTLPHALARVVLSEQLYRAVSLINQHPYHKGPALKG